MNYDIIGDIHGCHDSLTALLQKLDYQLIDGIYQHLNRKAVFLGDFVDRGPHQFEVIETARAMIEAGHAYAVMGNHEFNAIAYATPDPEDNGFLRAHTERNTRNHQAFLDAMLDHPERYTDTIDWFRTLPLWLDLGDIRIIHACWDRDVIAQIKQHYSEDGLINEALLRAASNPQCWEHEAIETLLKGKEIRLSDGASFKDSGGIKRHHMRIRWWDSNATTYKKAFVGPPAALSHIEDDPIEGDHLIEYGHHEVPLFIGHYWIQGTPTPLTQNIACVDYSIARRDGKLCAYRWDGEADLDTRKYVCVSRLEP